MKLHVTEAGSGAPALVFLHYWGGSGRTWAPVVERLAPAHRCVAPDLRGWGNSPKDADSYGLDAMADDVAGLVADLGLTNYVLVGHSMGGKIAQLLAGRRPPGLAGLVLVAPAPPSPLTVPAAQRQAMLESYQSHDGVESALAILAERPLSAATRERIITDTLAGAPAAKRAWLDSGMDLDIGTTAGAIDVPTLVIVGTEDRVETESALRREIAHRVPHATFEILPGVGHLSPLEAPEEIASAITRFLAADVGHAILRPSSVQV